MTNVLRNHINPVLHSIVSLFLSVALLAAAPVDFIADHFFRLVSFTCLLCFFNTLILLPTICFLIEPIYPSKLYAVCEYPSPRESTSPRVNFPEVCSPTNMEGKTSFPSCDSCVSDSSVVENQPSNIILSSSESGKTSSRTCDVDLDEEDDIQMQELCASLKRDILLQTQLKSMLPSLNLFPSAHMYSSPHFPSNQLDSRPPSLSTISEESSQSNSTTSLDQLSSCSRNAQPSKRIPNVYIPPSHFHNPICQPMNVCRSYDEILIKRALAMAAAVNRNSKICSNFAPVARKTRVSISIPSILTPQSETRCFLNSDVADNSAICRNGASVGDDAFSPHLQSDQSSPPPYSSLPPPVFSPELEQNSSSWLPSSARSVDGDGKRTPD